jgi:hypothetical protein
MLYSLHLDWNGARMDEFRRRASALVEAERTAIRAVASELLRHRRLTGDEVGEILSCGAGTAPSFGAPQWV